MVSSGHEVVVALSEPHDLLIREAFPHIEMLKLGGYNVQYPTNPRFFSLKIALQVPKMLLRHYRDRNWLKKQLSKREFDLIISDNRYAFYHRKVKSVIITHQLEIKTGHSFMDKMVQGLIGRLLRNFDECWVPDFKEEDNLAGALSHPKKNPPLPLVYLGPLSRFESREEPLIYDLAILLSGPEPQRSLFEKQILEQLKGREKKILMVRGLPKGGLKTEISLPNLEVHDHLHSEDLNRKILQSRHILCRSGYTTMMDLFLLGKTATIVPTPGQTEQEYLAKHLDGKYRFRRVEQQKMDVNLILDSID